MSFLASRRSQRINYLPTTPHSTYHYDICILHVVKVYRQNLNKLSCDTPAVFNSAFIYNVAGFEFNIDPYGMAIRNPNKLSCNALAGSNSAFIYNVASFKFNIDPHSIARRNPSKFSFSAPIGSNGAFIGNIISFDFNLGGYSNLSIN